MSFFKRELALAQEYLALMLLGLIDLFATGYIIKHQGAEANALPALILEHFHFVGFVIFKFAMLTLIVLLCEVISTKSPKKARMVITFGCIIYAAVVIYESVGIIKYIRIPQLNPSSLNDGT